MEIHYFGDRDAKTVLVQMVDEHDMDLMESEVRLIRDLTGMEFMLVAVHCDSWNNDLSPWKAPAVFGSSGFGDGAGRTLQFLTEKVIEPPKGRVFYLGGYSLSGLFALWAAYNSDAFEGVAAVSPSVWFPGFSDFCGKNAIRTKKVYLSLGDKEEKTRNAVMAKVGDAIRDIHGLLEEKGCRCVLEWNSGNHFREPDKRTARGFSWLLKQNQE